MYRYMNSSVEVRYYLVESLCKEAYLSLLLQPGIKMDL